MHLEPESQVTTFVELMRSSDKVSKEWKVLIKYKEQPIMLSLNCYTGTFLWSSLVHPVWLLLPSWSPKPWAPFSSVRVCVCLLPCWFLRCWQLQCIITGKCNAVDPLHLFFFSRRCIQIVHKLLCYQKKCRVRLHYTWRELWSGTLHLQRWSNIKSPRSG